MKPASAVVLLLALAGCSQDEPPQQLPSAATEASSDGAPLDVPSADGVPIRYRIYGDTAEAAQQPALIFIHGWGANSTYWDAQIDYFAKRHKVVTLDLAGHGDSGILRKRWTMDAFGDDVFAVAQRLPDQELVLIGHSMGGAVALQAARRLGERVIGIIGADAFQNMANPPAAAQALQRRLEPFRSDFQTAMRDYVARNFFRSSADPELVRRIAEDLASAQPGVVLGSIIAMNEMNYAAAVADIEVPLVAINSDIGPTDAERIRIHAPTFRLKIMRGVGHFVMIEDPLRFNGLLDETLQELTGEQR